MQPTQGPWVHKVSAKGYPVLLAMANFSPESECRGNDDCRTYRITRKFTELGVQSCPA